MRGKVVAVTKGNEMTNDEAMDGKGETSMELVTDGKETPESASVGAFRVSGGAGFGLFMPMRPAYEACPAREQWEGLRNPKAAANPRAESVAA